MATNTITESTASNAIPARDRFHARQFTIGTRLTACFVAIVLLMVASKAAALWQFHVIAVSEQALNQADQISLAAMLVHLDLDRLNYKLLAVADTSDGPDFARRATLLRQTFLKDIEHAQQLFNESVGMKRDPLIISTLQTLRVTVSRQIDAAMGLAAVNDWPAVRSRLTDHVQGLVDLSSFVVERVEGQVTQQRAEALSSSEQATRQVFTVQPAMLILTMLLAVLLGLHVTRSITGPLSELYTAAQALARGEFQHRVKLAGADELTALGRGFNYATRQLSELYDGLRESQEALRRSERELRDVVETIPALAYNAQPDGFRTFVNRQWLEYTGLNREQAAGRGWLTAVHPDHRERLVRKWEASLKTGEPLDDEIQFRRTDGEYRWFLTRALPLRDERGNILRWYGVATDIEDRKRAEEEREKLRQLETALAHVNRVTMMGEMTASIAHEINQPLSGVVSNGSACLRWLAAKPANLEEAQAAAQRIVRDGKRAGEIIARVRALAKKAPPEKAKLNLNEIVGEVVALVADEAKKRGVAIGTEFAAGLDPVLGDRVQLQQVVLNIVINAMDAMSSTASKRLIITTSTDEMGQARVTVQDTGIGLDANTSEHIFDPFFSTKSGGMGMGLSISRSIIQAHGGRLWAAANKGPGATVGFTIPPYKA
ncbi:MAG: PAS domain-containing protein, partial [Deltaproteobacteria bacterium]|nr:PAS domain-containing protein [Deltaproteobacteria bacterium]